MQSRLQKDLTILWKHIAFQKGTIHRQNDVINELRKEVDNLEKTNRKILVSFSVLLVLLALL